MLFLEMIADFYMDKQFLPVISCKQKLLQSLVHMESGGPLFSCVKLNLLKYNHSINSVMPSAAGKILVN